MLFVQSGIFLEPYSVDLFTIIEDYECAIKTKDSGVIGNSVLNGKVVQKMTDKDIQEAINDCIWRMNVCGVWVCEGDVVPCEKHIHDGKCPTLIELYAKEKGIENE